MPIPKSFRIIKTRDCEVPGIRRSTSTLIRILEYLIVGCGHNHKMNPISLHRPHPGIHQIRVYLFHLTLYPVAAHPSTELKPNGNNENADDRDGDYKLY